MAIQQLIVDQVSIQDLVKNFKLKEVSLRINLNQQFKQKSSIEPAINTMPKSKRSVLLQPKLALTISKPLEYDDSVDYLGERDERKLNEIIKIKVNKPVEDVEKFTDLIKHCKNVKYLHLKNVTFSQSFYDQLPDLCEDILTLDIETQMEGNQINCDFVKGFGRLESFSINQPLSSNVVEDLVYCDNICEHLKSVYFKHPDYYIEFRVLDREDYRGRERDIDFNPTSLRIGRYRAEFNDYDAIGFLRDILKI